MQTDQKPCNLGSFVGSFVWLREDICLVFDFFRKIGDSKGVVERWTFVWIAAGAFGDGRAVAACQMPCSLRSFPTSALYPRPEASKTGASEPPKEVIWGCDSATSFSQRFQVISVGNWQLGPLLYTQLCRTTAVLHPKLWGAFWLFLGCSSCSPNYITIYVFSLELLCIVKI